MKFYEICFMLTIFLLGILSSEIYHNYYPQIQIVEKEVNVNISCIQDYDGLRFVAEDKEAVKSVTNEYDEYGDWVCVNIKDMKYDRALEVCSHEVGHEIFAEVCEKNMTKCLGVIQ